jgi:nicotinamide riboside kinase
MLPQESVVTTTSALPGRASIVPGEAKSILGTRAWEYPSPQYVLGSWRDEHKLCGDGISNVANGENAARSAVCSKTAAAVVGAR